MVQTKRVTERRELQFSSIQEILDDVEYLDSGDPPRTTGNWTAGQIVQHVAKLIAFSIDGFPGPRFALPLRILGRLMRNRALADSLRPGFKIPAKAAALTPAESITWDEAVQYLRDTVNRLGAERMNAPSPLLGKLTHDQWEQLHCRHAELHFSFMHPA